MVSDVEERRWVLKAVKSEKIYCSERSVYKRKKILYSLFQSSVLAEVKTELNTRNYYIISLFPEYVVKLKQICFSGECVHV